MIDYKKIGEINDEIDKLQEMRTEIINKGKFDNEQEIKNLEWTKDCYARVEFTLFCAAGLPSYIIYVCGEKIPEVIKPVTVMGDDVFYERNMLYGRSYLSDGKLCFYTSSEKMMVEFLKKVKFIKVEFNESYLRILEAARGAG